MSGTDWENRSMPRFSRQELRSKFLQMVGARQPIIGGGAGTGLSAKCEEAGGIDLIVIYNSGRYRMAGRGSLSGMLAYGNANDVVMEMAKEVLRIMLLTVSCGSVTFFSSLNLGSGGNSSALSPLIL